MPLPKPPATRAAILPPSAYDTQAAPKSARHSPQAGAASADDDTPPRLALRKDNSGTLASPPLPTKARAVAAPAPVARPAKAAQAKPRKPRASGPAKLFVLDTNVLMHDPMSLFRFEEHDIYLPMITLEELDGHKKGMSEVSRNVRQVSRELDALAGDDKLDASAGIPLAKTGHREAGGKLFFQTTLKEIKLPAGLPQGKADNQILGVVQSLREEHPGREVVLVSKDINMRVKARALGLCAEDYYNDKTLDDGDLLYTGVLPLPTSGSGTARRWKAGARVATPTTASAARWCPPCSSTSSSTSSHRAKRRCMRG